MHAAFDVAVTSAVLNAYIDTLAVLGLQHKDGDQLEHTVEVGLQATKMLDALSSCSQISEVDQFGRSELMEWLDGSKQADPGHRHFSHLFALYPGDTIHPQLTPKLAAAATAALDARRLGGSGHTSWSRAWMTILEARLQLGNDAALSVQILLQRYMSTNLLSLHPSTEVFDTDKGCDTCYAESPGPKLFQLDGNAGLVAAVAEMLLQSHIQVPLDGDTNAPSFMIQLLPSLPSSWPEGHFEGLRARGGVILGVSWSAGLLTHATFKFNGSTTGTNGVCVVQYDRCVLQKMDSHDGRDGNVKLEHTTFDALNIQPKGGLNADVDRNSKPSVVGLYKIIGIKPHTTVRLVCSP